MSTHNELISIIIPVYNPPLEKFKQCLQSILAQSYKNIEIIIVDDGSNNTIKRFLNSFDQKIRIFSQKNSGVSAARNAGIYMAKGKYITFVDADDYLDKDWINSLSIFFDKEYDIIFGRVIMCKENELRNYIRKTYVHKTKAFFENQLIDVQNMLMLNDAVSPLPNLPYLDLGPCGKLYKRSVVKGVKFPNNIKLGEDQVFNHIVINKCKKVLITNYKAYYYIENQKSVSHTKRIDAVNIMNEAMTMVYKELISKKDELNNFYYLVNLNLFVMLKLELQGDFLSRLRVISSVYKIKTFPIYNSIRKIKIRFIPGKKNKIKLFLLKYHLLYLFFMIKDVVRGLCDILKH